MGNKERRETEEPLASLETVVLLDSLAQLEDQVLKDPRDREEPLDQMETKVSLGHSEVLDH